MKTHLVQQTKHQLRHDVSKYVNFWNTKTSTEPLYYTKSTIQRMLLNDEKKLQDDEKQQTEKLKNPEKT